MLTLELVSKALLIMATILQGKPGKLVKFRTDYWSGVVTREHHPVCVASPLPGRHQAGTTSACLSMPSRRQEAKIQRRPYPPAVSTCFAKIRTDGVPLPDEVARAPQHFDPSQRSIWEM